MPRHEIKYGDIYISKSFDDSVFHGTMIFVLQTNYVKKGNENLAFCMLGNDPDELGVYVSQKALKNNYVYVGNLDD